MLRHSVKSLTVTAGTAIADSTVIDFRGFAGGVFLLTATGSPTTLTWYACDTEDGTFLPIYWTKDSTETAVTSAVTKNRAQMIPAACFGASYLKAASDAAATLKLTLKS